ncbi:MAG: ABC transporter transmembrane domain-containing protein [Alphaproteobacteria bacterium]
MARFDTASDALERPKSRNIGILWQIAGFLAPYWKRVIAALVALIGTAAVVLALGQGLRALVDQGLSAAEPDALQSALASLLLLGLLLAAGGYARYYLMTWLGERVVADMRNAVFKRVLSLDPVFFEVTKTGEVLSRITTDTTVLQSVVGSSMSIALRNAILLIGGLVMMMVTNIKLAALALLLVPIVVVPVLFIGRRVRKLARASQDRVADVGAFAEESLNAIQTVQAFTHEDLDRKRFGEEVAAALSTALTRAHLRGLLNVTVTIVVFFGIGAVLWVGGGDVVAGRISGGELMAFLYYAIIVAFAAGIVSEVYGDLQRAAGATERLIELLATETSIRPPDRPVPLPEPPVGKVSFEDVTFNYPSRPNRSALQGFSLTVEPGETVALVGPSGAGKSTVFQLLLRFYDPTEGTVRLDGMDLRQVDPTAFRKRMALVPQEPYVFGENVSTNIRYGDPDASDEAVEEAARNAMAHGFVSELPEGYDTYLGEKGIRLSGGQRQRLSIARAILRNPSVLLLDEATSALDAENERLVQQALDRLMQNRTTLVIAHRLATVKNADRIVVMNDGRIEAIGTHSDLLKSSPLYAHLAELQFTDGAKQAAE